MLFIKHINYDDKRKICKEHKLYIIFSFIIVGKSSRERKKKCPQGVEVVG